MSRDVTKQPFADTAIWNIPIGAAASYVDAQLVPRTAWVVDGRAAPIMMDPNAAVGTVWKNIGQQGNGTSPGGSGLREYATSPLTDTIGVQVPVIAGMIVPSSQSNSTCAMVGADGKQLYEAGQSCHGTAGVYAGASPVTNQSVKATPGVMTAGHASHYSTIQGEGLLGACAGSGLSTLGGVIRKGEFASGVIPHALRCDINGHTDMWGGGGPSGTDTSKQGPGYRWPATKQDGTYADIPITNNHYGGGVSACREGSLLAIPATGPNKIASSYAACVAALSVGGSLGIQTVPGQIMAINALTYGWMPCNDSVTSRITFPFEQDAVSDGLAEFQTLYNYAFPQKPGVSGNAGKWASDMAIIVAHLYVVDSNTSTQYATNVTNYGLGVVANYTGAGGGAPLVPIGTSTGTSLTAPFNQQVNASTTASATALNTGNAATKTGSLLAVLAGAMSAGTAATPAQVGTSWQAPAQSGTANTNAVLASHTVTTGNIVLIYVENRNPAVAALTSVAKTAGTSVMGTFTQLATVTTISLETLIEVWMAPVTTGGTLTITATYAAASAGIAYANEWSGTAGVLDHAVFTYAPTAGKTSVALSDPTATTGSGCLTIAVYGTKATPTGGFSAQGFSPSGTGITVPDLAITATGSDNCLLETSSQISGPAGEHEGFGAVMAAATYAGVILCLAPTTSGGSAPVITASGGGTWTSDASVNAGSGLATAALLHVTPTAVVAGNGVTLASSAAGSIESELYEIAGYSFQAKASATGNSTAPTVSITPTATTDVQVAMIYWNGNAHTMTAVPGGAWINDAQTVGLGGTGANSSMISGANVPGVATSQTYAGTLSATSQWVAIIANYSLAAATVPGTPSAPVVTALPGALVVDWTLPTGTGITTSTVELYIGGVLNSTTVISAPTSIVTILADPSQLYTADVFCSSTAGAGTASTQSSPAVQPLPVPTPPIVTPIPTPPLAHPVISSRYAAALKQP